MLKAYKIGDRDARPWGSYIVTGVGQNENGEYCDKDITIHAGQVLSLQSHKLRRETWTVVEGVLTVLVDGQRLELQPGQTVHIPKGSIHCMAALGKTQCVVQERQEGVCREEDIIRYVDAYGRATADASSPVVAVSIAAYQKILAELGHK